MATSRKTLLIKSARQLRALRTPVRQEIVRTLVRKGTCTVREIADDLGREPAALYYHVHALVDAGIAKEKGKLDAGARPETVYSLVAERIMIDRREKSKAFLSALGDLQRATLRAAERELAASLKAHGPKLGDDSTSLLRLSARLKAKDAARASKMLREVADFLAEHDDPAEAHSYSLTAALVRTPK
jgi:predicted ArsR family transcriptional regulator